MTYKVKIETFEGPLDLLLKLTEEQKLDITQVSLARVTDDFLKYVQILENNLENLSEFLDIASKLIVIKSKVILPQIELTKEEQEDIEDLEERLKEYKIFKKISQELRFLTEREERGFARKTKIQPQISVFDPPNNVDYKLLFKLLEKVIEEMPKEEEHSRAVVKKTVSMEEKISEIKLMLSNSKTFNFGHFLKKAKEKVEIIVSFLAILELLKLKFLKVEQDSNFSEIILTRDS